MNVIVCAYIHLIISKLKLCIFKFELLNIGIDGVEATALVLARALYATC